MLQLSMTLTVLDEQWRSQDFKVGGTPMTWPEGPMRSGVFREGQRSAAPLPII